MSRAAPAPTALTPEVLRTIAFSQRTTLQALIGLRAAFEMLEALHSARSAVAIAELDSSAAEGLEADLGFSPVSLFDGSRYHFDALRDVVTELARIAAAAEVPA